MRRPSQFRRIMSPGEREAKLADLREQEIQLRSPDMVGLDGGRTSWAANPVFSSSHSGVATQKAAKIRRELEQESQLIEDCKKGLDKEIKILEEKVSSKMVPRDWMWAKEGTPERRKAVEAIVEVEQGHEYQRDALKLQNRYRARSALNAKLSKSREDPNCASLEHLRK